MITKEQVFVNEKHWRNMSESELNYFTRDIFHYYRETGFPYYPVDEKSRRKDFEKLMNYDRTNLFEDKVFKQTMHGLGLAWSYFPYAFEVRCGNKMTPYEAFMDDEIFMKVIQKRLKMGTYISDSGIRKMLKIYSGVQGVSNFRPTAAAAIYDTFAKNGVVWDMSGGWGGRLLGAIASGVKTYIATEPSTNTYHGLLNLSSDFGLNINSWIYNMGSEDFEPPKNILDLCFTSPPYFDLEKYSNEETQSYIKYPTKDKWVEGYLAETFKNCYYGLKSGGVMLINIADIKGKELEKDIIKTAEKVGFKYRTEYKLTLSNVNLRNKDKKFKYEPIYLFVK
ncbi:MAG: DNA methyltransferase [Bacteroidales bacterium]|nr:DNA methyltransferase [Bacteroidales bacterium]